MVESRQSVVYVGADIPSGVVGSVNLGPGTKMLDVGTRKADAVSHKVVMMHKMKKKHDGSVILDALLVEVVVVVIVSAFSVDSVNTRGNRFPVP